jgi:hypothetical protein
MSQYPLLSLYTSIPPHVNRSVAGKPFADYQGAVIKSWKDAGFRVISVNSDVEIDALKKYSGEVEFVSNGTYNERSKISAFFDHIIASKEEHVGIVNADCVFFNYDGFADGLLKATSDSIILFERLNLDPDTARPTGRTCSGFDAFFFDTKFLGDVENSNQYEIGEPHWDHWFPLAMNLAGAELKIPQIPIFLHVDHPHKWSWDTFRTNGDKLIKFILSQQKDPKALPGFLEEVGKIASGPKFGDRYVRKLTELVFKSLRSQARLVSLTRDGTHADLIGRMFVGLSQSKELYFRDRMNQLTLAGRLRTLGSVPEMVARKIAKRIFP